MSIDLCLTKGSHVEMVFEQIRSPNQRANQIRRSYKNEEFDWLFDFVIVT